MILRSNGAFHFPRTLTTWILLILRMARPVQLGLIAVIYGWGVLLAPGNLQPDTIVRLIPLILVSASVHYANEYADYDTDLLTIRTPFSGGSGAMQQLQAPRNSALLAAWLSMIPGAGIALLMTWKGNLPVISLACLLLGGALGWMYSLPPLSLVWRGWGEVTNVFLGSILLPIYGYTTVTGQVSTMIAFVTLPFALLTFLNLLATHWPDRDADRQVGKRTLAASWSEPALRQLYYWVLGLYVITISVLSFVFVEIPWIRFGLLTVPFSLGAGLVYTRQVSPLPSVAVMALYLSLNLFWQFTIRF